MKLLSMFIAVAVYMGIGGLWYSQLAFGKQWMELIGKKKEELLDPIKAMSYAVILAIMLAFGMSDVIVSNGAANIGDVLKVVLFLWTLFIFPITANEVIFGGKPIKLFLIHAGNQLVSLFAMGIVFLYIQ